MESVFYRFETQKIMITKEKILEILHSHSYNVEDQAGNHLIVVDDGSWDAVATEVKNCSMPDVSGCTCALESTDVYDDNENYLGYVCLGCGYFSKY